MKRMLVRTLARSLVLGAPLSALGCTVAEPLARHEAPLVIEDIPASPESLERVAAAVARFEGERRALRDSPEAAVDLRGEHYQRATEEIIRSTPEGESPLPALRALRERMVANEEAEREYIASLEAQRARGEQLLAVATREDEENRRGSPEWAILEREREARAARIGEMRREETDGYIRGASPPGPVLDITRVLETGDWSQAEYRDPADVRTAPATSSEVSHEGVDLILTSARGASFPAWG
jgi:hypothetical protein